MGAIFKSALALLAFLVVFSLPVFATFSINIASPANTTFTTTFSNPVALNVNYSFAGNESVVTPCFWTLDGGNNTQLTLCQNFSFSFAVGYHNLTIIANSTLNHTNSTQRNFTVYSNFTFFNASINNVIPNVIVKIVADTFVENGNCPANNLAGSAPDGNITFNGFNSTLNHGSERYIIFSSYNYPYGGCQFTYPTQVYSLWKVNVTNSTYSTPSIIQQKVIESGYFQGIGSTACGGGQTGNKTLYWSPAADDWNETNITYSNCGSVCTLDVAGSSGREITNSAVWGAENFVNNQAATYFFSAPDVVQSIYNSTTGLVTFALDNGDTGTACNQQQGWGTWKYTLTKESATPNYAQANFTLVDYISSGNDYPLFSTIFQDFYYDFETGSINSQGAQSANPLSSSFPQADFSWNVGTNTLTPSNGATALVVAVQNDTTNTLANAACAGYTGYSASPISGLNTPVGSQPQYYVICFNLTATHNGHPFFGAIKVNNAQTNQVLGIVTGGDFNFWAAIYSPAFTSFSIPTRIPATVNGGDNVSYFWTSSQPTTTGVQYFITPSGGTTTVITLVSNGSLTLSHAYTITGALLAPQTQVTFKVFGVTNDSTTIWSPYVDSFTVQGQTGVQNNLTDIIQPINGGSGGLGIFPFNELGYTTSGFVMLDNLGWVHTSLATCDNCTFQILFNDTYSYYLYKPTVNVVQYTPDLATVGTHNVKIRDDSGYRYRDYNFTISYNPYALAIRVLPNTCVPYLFWGTEDFCRNDMVGLNISSYPNATGQFCQFNPTECQLFNYSTGQCIQQAQHISNTGSGLLIGGWVHYVCFNDANLGYYNQSIVNGTPLTGGTSPSDQLGNAGANFLGITPEAFKATIAMILILIISGLMAWKTKDGLITGLFFEGGMGLFLLMGWLPLWFLIVFGVLAAFMIAKFARHLIAPSGGD
jgi:hypothetical protein